MNGNEPENEKPKISGKRIVLLIILLAIPLLAYLEISAGVLSNAVYASKRRLVPTDITVEYGTTGGTTIMGGKNGFLCATKDGAVFYSNKGETLWSVTYTMQSPHVVKSGESWAIMEPLGRTVYVCGPEGLLYIVSAESPILSVGLNRISCLIMIVSTESGYSIRVYNANGERATERATELDGVVPTAAALSDDGYIFTVGYLDTTKTILSRTLYFYTDSGASRYGTDDRAPFKAIELPNAIITKMAFGKNNNLICITDISAFITTARGEPVWSYDLQNHMLDYSFGDTEFGFVAGGAMANALESVPSGTASWFGYDGVPLADTLPKEEDENEGLFPSPHFEKIDVYDKHVLLKSKTEYILMDKSGKRIWAHDATGDILSIVPIGANKAVIAKNGFAQIYELKIPRAND